MRRRAELIIQTVDEITGAVTNTYNSKTYGFYVTTSESFRGAERDRTEVIIPGRNGSVFRDNGRYNSVLVTYTAFVHKNFIDNFNTFKTILLSQTRKFRLRDSNDPNHYREALYSGEISGVGHILEEVMEVTFEFICSPERFQDVSLNTGSTRTTTTGGYSYISGTTSNFSRSLDCETLIVGRHVSEDVTVSKGVATVDIPIPWAVYFAGTNYLNITTGVNTKYKNQYTFTTAVSVTSLSGALCRYWVVIDSRDRSVMIKYEVYLVDATYASGYIRLGGEVSGAFPVIPASANGRLRVDAAETFDPDDSSAWSWDYTVKGWEL